VRAFAGLGSNVGDRLAHLRGAVEALRSAYGVEVVACSPVYETDPIGPQQPDFLNAVVELETDLEPRELLRVFQAAEASVGRTPTQKWGPREIDIDLLLYGQARIDEPDLRVPHLQLVKRAFVLVPLAQVAPDAEVPGAGSVVSLAERVDASGVRPTDHLLDLPT
jgi:2-amino-4-hydroxy-6-hydroxymethyldihydropteridine diphosphokinase